MKENRMREREEETCWKTERGKRLAARKRSITLRQCRGSNGSALPEKHERFNFLVKHEWRRGVAEGEGTMPLILFYQAQ